MSLNVPDFMPVLSAGFHESPQEGACVMEYISFIAGEDWTDLPSCTNVLLAVSAQRVNDNLNNTDRQRLLDLIPRLMGTGINGDEILEALAEAAATYVQPLIGHHHFYVDLGANEAQRALADPALRVRDAWHAVKFSDMDKIEFLSALIDAYDKAVGRTSTPVVTADDLRRCAELTSTH